MKRENLLFLIFICFAIILVVMGLFSAIYHHTDRRIIQLQINTEQPVSGDLSDDEANVQYIL